MIDLDALALRSGEADSIELGLEPAPPEVGGESLPFESTPVAGRIDVSRTTSGWALHLLSENIAVVLTWAPLDGQVASHSPVRALVTLAVYAALPVAAALVVFHRRDLVG